MERDEFLRRMAVNDVKQQEAVIEELHSEFVDPFVRRGMRRGLRKEDAEDAAQDTFLAAWKNVSKLAANDAPLGPWLFAILRNKINDILDGYGVKVPPSNGELESENDGGDPWHELPRVFPESDEVLCKKESLKILWKRSPDEVDVFIDYCAEEIGIADVRRLLKCSSEGAAYQQIYEWRGKLKAICVTICEPFECGMRRRKSA